jgi:hypothetical protein
VALQSANELHEEMMKISKKWRSYQRSRVKKGKSSSDWTVPRVRIAYVRNTTDTARPYSSVAEIKDVSFEIPR